MCIHRVRYHGAFPVPGALIFGKRSFLEAAETVSRAMQIGMELESIGLKC